MIQYISYPIDLYCLNIVIESQFGVVVKGTELEIGVCELSQCPRHKGRQVALGQPCSLNPRKKTMWNPS